MSALLSSTGSVFINLLNRNQIGSASSIAAPRKDHEIMVEGPNCLNFPRARSLLRHSNLVTNLKEKLFFMPHHRPVYSIVPTFKKFY